MLHNSGPYGPSDVPANMGAPINKSHSGPVNLVHNLESLGKMSQDSQPIPVPQCNDQDYTSFGHHPLHIASQVNPFTSFSQQGYARVPSHNINHDSSVHSQNGFLPFNFNAQNNINSHYHSQFLNKPVQQEINNDYKHRDIGARSTPLNIPQIYTKTYQKPNDIVNNTIQSFTYNINEKFMVNSKKTENTIQNSSPTNSTLKTITKEANSRAERIENAVKHIENIIASDMLYRKQESEQKLQNAAFTHESKEDNSDPQEDQSESFNTLNEDSNSDTESDSKEPENETKKDCSNIKNHSIEIKIEPGVIEEDMEEKITWTDNEYDNPFIKDLNGVTKDRVGNAKIIEGDRSINEAMNISKQGLQASSDYYECPHCTLLFNHHQRFLIHVKWHTFGLTNLKKQQLAEAREVRKALHRGEVVDTKSGGEFPCPECDKVFSRMSALKSHQTKVHKDTNRQCRICKLVLGDYKSYVDHQATAHTTETGEFKCTRCDKLFKYRHTLAKHSAVHDEKTHACPQCPKLYGSQLLLKEHLRTHERTEKEPAFHCSYCGKGFMDSFNLQSHERGHRNEKPFGCAICSTSFGTNSSLKRHLRVSHSSSKPHVCSTCRRSFSTAIIRDRHEMRAHGDPDTFKYRCTLCACKYLKPNDLRKHVSKIHPKRRKTKEVESE